MRRMLPVPSGSRVLASSVSDLMFCVGQYGHRAASGRLLPEATTGLGGSGLWNASVTAGKNFLENDNADEVLTKGTNGNEMHTRPLIYLDARKLELTWNIHATIF